MAQSSDAPQSPRFSKRRAKTLNHHSTCLSHDPCLGVQWNPCFCVGSLRKARRCTPRSSLTGSQEVPPRTTAATGTVTLTISSDRARITYKVVTVGPFTSDVRQAHIHVQQPDVNGPVVLFYCTNLTPLAAVPTPQPCLTAGGTITGTHTAADFISSAAASALGVNTFADIVTSILNGSTYSNVHTVTFPVGEIRGQNVL